MTDHDPFGATYQPEPNEWCNSPFWLCNVVHFILGEHPETILFRKVAG